MITAKKLNGHAVPHLFQTLAHDINLYKNASGFERIYMVYFHLLTLSTIILKIISSLWIITPVVNETLITSRYFYATAISQPCLDNFSPV